MTNEQLDTTLATGKSFERAPRARLNGLRPEPETFAKTWTGQVWQRTYVRGIIVLDISTVLLGVGLAFLGATLAGEVNTADTALALSVGPLWIFSLVSARLYEMRHLGAGSEEFKRVLLAGIWLTAVVGTGSFVLNAPASRLLVAAALPGVTLLLLIERGIARTLLNMKRKNGACRHRVVAVGGAKDIEHLMLQIDRAVASGWEIVAVCVPDVAETELRLHGHVFPVGSPGDAAITAAIHGADTIAITNPATLPPEGLRRLAWELEGSQIHLLISPALTDVAGPRITVRPLSNLPLLHLEQPQFDGPQRLYKDVTDRVCAAVGILLLSPLLIGIALAIKLGDHGPVLFKQSRIGVGGKAFTCFKFRSMCAEADQMFVDLTDGGVMFKIKRDPRITPVGAFLRRGSLDELPQLINVVRGEMSLVGPRPQVQSEVDAYERDHHRRLLVKPGMTGLWQVSGRSDLSWEEAVRLDLYYVENWSPLVDFNILTRTVSTVLRGSGAY